jgi:hypothetical protein
MESGGLPIELGVAKADEDDNGIDEDEAVNGVVVDATEVEVEGVAIVVLVIE